MAEKKGFAPIAISGEEAEEYGCPYCGYRSTSCPIQGMGTAIHICGECEKVFAVLAPGLTKATIGIGDFYPELQWHPRKGIPSHGTPDKKPEEGVEFFHSRGIGLDNCPGCFVCGGGEDLYNNIAAFVQCKAAGKRVVAMFKTGAWLDYRHYEPDRVQVKIGACDQHIRSLQELDRLTRERGATITIGMIKEVIELKL